MKFLTRVFGQDDYDGKMVFSVNDAGTTAIYMGEMKMDSCISHHIQKLISGLMTKYKS